jgi:hypothetical protein
MIFVSFPNIYHFVPDKGFGFLLEEVSHNPRFNHPMHKVVDHGKISQIDTAK